MPQGDPPRGRYELVRVLRVDSTFDRMTTQHNVALDETVIEGIQTNIPLHRELMVDAKFVEGGTDIHYLENWMAARKR